VFQEAAMLLYTPLSLSLLRMMSLALLLLLLPQLLSYLVREYGCKCLCTEAYKLIDAQNRLRISRMVKVLYVS
jgi:hypothetical protein